jgi:hypothetical protein
MSLAFDENGRPFIILREQEKKKRIKGLEAHKVSSILDWSPNSKLCLAVSCHTSPEHIPQLEC